MGFLIIALYLLLICINYKALRAVDVSNLRLSDGLLVGMTFYITIPMGVILAYGYVYAPGIMADAYYPYDDHFTTLNIFLGCFLLCVYALLIRKLTIVGVRTHGSSIGADTLDIGKLIVFLYFSLSIYSFLSSGMLSADSHWHSSVAEAMSGSSSLIILKNFSLAYRTMIFGIFLYWGVTARYKVGAVLSLALFVSLFDMLVTYNRITLVYFAVLMLVLWRRYIYFLVAGILISLPVVSWLSELWAAFRATNQGFSIESFSKALSESINYVSIGDDFVVRMNSIFESSNIVVLHYLVENVGESFPVLWGETYIVRPLTTFIPSSIWSDKPRVFGTYLGEYINSHNTLALNSTFYGEAIGNFYWLWPVAMIVFVLIFDSIFIYLKKWFVFSGFMGFFVGVAIWRFDMNFASACLYSLLFSVLMHRFILLVAGKLEVKI